MPNSSLEAANQTTERLSACIIAEPFQAIGETMREPALKCQPVMRRTQRSQGLFKRAHDVL